MVENEEKIEDMYDDDADDDEDRKKQPSNSSFFDKTPTSANIQCTKRKRMKADELDRDVLYSLMIFYMMTCKNNTIVKLSTVSFRIALSQTINAQKDNKFQTQQVQY